MSSEGFNLYSFSTEIADRKILYVVLKMNCSAMIFINYKDEKKLEDLSAAMLTPYHQLPFTTKLIGSPVEEVSEVLAAKVSKYLNKPIYMSYNVPYDKVISPLIEKQLFVEINAKPDKF